ncbi:MAG: iron oxidase [Verrucomicrobiota bacterium]
MSSSKHVSRRTAIGTFGAVAASTCGLSVKSRAEDYVPQFQNKLTKAAARYQDTPKGAESCAVCPYFVAPAGCVVVEGEIKQTGWCPMMTTFSPLDRGAHL